jgi:putative transposase
MSHSYNTNLIHLVFSTKERRNLIPRELQEKLWAYFVGIGRNHKIPVLAAGGIPNHIHLLFGLPATSDLSTAVATFKANSSRWLSEHGHRFAWQEGYGAFSVSPSRAESVKSYIRTQEEHHRKRTFEEEFVTLLEKSGVPYDPKYLFG